MVSVHPIEDESFMIENRDASGVVRVELDCDTVKILSHTGTADVVASGRCRVGQFFNQGLGITDARNLACQSAFVNNSSINNIFVNASIYLFATLRYSGNVFVSGSPQGYDIDNRSNGRVIFTQ
jgi:hypothetical protein